MDTDDSLRDGRKRGKFLVRKLGVANEASRIEDRMLGDEAFDPLLGRRIEGIVGCAKIGEFSFASRKWYFMRREKGNLAGNALEGTVGMPKLVCQHEHTPPVGRRTDVVVLVQV